MPPLNPQNILSAAHIAPEFFALRPDYRALVLIAVNIPPSHSDAQSEAYLCAAEQAAKSALASTPMNQTPHVLTWRDTYKAFGAKPKKTLNSLEALLKRVDVGLAAGE
ncbi:hypothetical protein BDU57DRAFT_523175 [Ampelomyces quisqualis]|uniref:Uncharacterized protein n=1 Tax=Ampelomyces quisqualis TaxID=50730 RepID=A0A6A5Q9A4_AMPQU|nr:hypothetical protein BDU57DRAFT_523175 [Ampelomyces quisqualis]